MLQAVIQESMAILPVGGTLQHSSNNILQKSVVLVPTRVDFYDSGNNIC